MKTRRMAYWWFRFVVSGRFLEKFLRLRRPLEDADERSPAVPADSNHPEVR